MTMPVTDDAIRRSAQTVPRAEADKLPPAWGPGDALTELSVFTIASFADDISPWGYLTRLRDVQLREFLPTEPLLSSAFATVAARNAAFSWRFDGGDRLVQRAQDILQYANFGAGWRNFVTRFTYDLIGQDNGAFVEVIRETDTPAGRVVGIANLDAGRCWRTGDPRSPVLYTALDGTRHLMPWWQVIAFAEMPANIERLRGLQYSAITRALRGAQLFRDIQQYHREKLGGRRARAIHFVNNVSSAALSDALAKAKAQADNEGLYRYLEPIVVEGLKPGEAITTSTLELAALPDGFAWTEFYNQYIDGLAMALLSDRQDFVPLQGGNIGTSTQSEVLAQKTRGKGPGLFMKLVEDAFNFYGIFGNGVRFKFDEQDLTEDRQKAEVDDVRARGRKTYIDAGVLTPQVVRQQMVDEGELAQVYLELMQEEDVTDEATGTDAAPLDADAEVEVTQAEQVNVTPAVPTAPVTVSSKPAASEAQRKMFCRVCGGRTVRGVSVDKATACEFCRAPVQAKIGDRPESDVPAAIRKDPTHKAMDDTEAEAKRLFEDGLAEARAAMARAVRKAVPAEAKVVTEVKAVADAAQRALAEQAAANARAVEATVGAAKDSIESAVLQAATTQADAQRQAAEVSAQAAADLAAAVRESGAKADRSAEAAAEMAAAVRELAKPRRRRVVRGPDGRATHTEEEIVG